MSAYLMFTRTRPFYGQVPICAVHVNLSGGWGTSTGLVLPPGDRRQSGLVGKLSMKAMMMFAAFCGSRCKSKCGAGTDLRRVIKNQTNSNG
jgi:hypothetical protein